MVSGLEVGLETEPAGGGARYWLHVAAGFGLTARGEDVVVPRNLRVSLDELFYRLPTPRPAAPEPPAAESGSPGRGGKAKETETPAADKPAPRPKSRAEAKAEADAAARAEAEAAAAGAANPRLRIQPTIPFGTVRQRGGGIVPDAVRDAMKGGKLVLPQDDEEGEPQAPEDVWGGGSMIKPLLPQSLAQLAMRRGEIGIGQADSDPLRRRPVPMLPDLQGPVGELRGKQGLPRAAVLVLRPVELELVGEADPRDPCEHDPQNDAFADWQRADGMQLVLYAFPWEDRVGTVPETTWRNRLAYEIFSAEAALAPGERLPWEEEGLPVALIGFDDAGAPLWADGYAVVRDGGRPHRRTPLLAGVGDPFLWQARLQQFAEQVAEVDWSLPLSPEEREEEKAVLGADADLSEPLARARREFRAFASFPPAGLLPRAAVDLEKNEVAAFPSDYFVEAVPVPMEQLDAAIEASAALEPFSAESPDRVRVLVPVPAAHYEPRLLQDEEPDPQFAREIDERVHRRAELVVRREEVRRRAELLALAAAGRPLSFPPPERDPERLEDEGGAAVLPVAAGEPAHQSAIRQGIHQHAFQYPQPIPIAVGDTLYAWVYPDPVHRPTQIILQWRDAAGTWEHRAYWGDSRFPFGVEGTASLRFMGPLPPAGRWTRLEIPAHRVGLEGLAVAATAFTLVDGRVTWDRSGKFASTDQAWLEDEGLPAGVEIVGERVQFVDQNPIPFSGKQARVTDAAEGPHQHTIGEFEPPLVVERGDVLFAYVWLDHKRPPREVMLQWHDGTWEHRAYWGDDLLDWGVNGTAGRRYMGPLPAPGAWARLEVPADVVGLEGKAVTQLAFAAWGGRVAWDRSGRRRPTGAGLWGEYYAGTDFNELRMARLDPAVNFDWAGGSPDPRVPADNFSVRWTGYLVPLEKESYTLHVQIDNGVRMWIDGERVIDDWAEKPPREVTAVRALEPGKRYEIRLEMKEHAGGAAARLSWSNPRRAREIIPRAQLFPPEGATGAAARLADEAWTGAPIAVGSDEEWAWVNEPALRPVEGEFGTALDAGVRRVTAVETLKAQLNSPAGPRLFDAAEVAALDRAGLDPFIDRLSATLKRAEDYLDMSFTRVQSDIYRLRRLMLGRTAATRLATSPALASIVKSRSALKQREQLLSYLDTVKAGPGLTQQAGSATNAASTAGPTAEATPGGFVFANLFLAAQPMTLQSSMMGTTFARAVSSGMVAKAAIGETQFAAAPRAPTPPPPAPAAMQISSLSSAMLSQTMAPIRAFIPPPPRAGTQQAATIQEVIFSRPLIGDAYDFRTVTVGERLHTPPANEAKSFAVLTRYEVLAGLRSLPLALDDVFLPGFPKVTQAAVPAAPGKPAQPAKLATRTVRVLQDRATKSFSESQVIVRAPRTWGEVKAEGVLESLVLEENDHADADEAAFFSMGVELLDATVAGLRNVEARVQQYREALRTAVETLQEVSGQVQSVDRRLKELGDELAETRHDVAVARALYEDEKARVRAVNERRKAVLRDHVHFFAFQRPRLSAGLLDAPSRPLNPAFTQSPVPAALRDGEAAPPELRAIVEVLREAPLRFFRSGERLLGGLDALAVLRGTLEQARGRAQKGAPNTLDALEQRLIGKLGSAIGRTLLAQRQVVALFRQRAAQVDLGALYRMSWARMRDHALEHLSLGDLIDAAHGRTAVDRGATKELDDVLRVAAALYRELGEVRPALRLDWAESLSQYDQAADLHNLFALPRFGEIDFLSRREMQALVDWLFGRIDPRVPEAAAMMSDVVRVCILLASHAPVNQIVAGTVPRETEARVGGTVEIAADPLHVRVGMHVLLYDVARRPVHAVVEDVGDGTAVTRILHASSPSVTIARDARAQLGEQARLAALPAFSGRPQPIGSAAWKVM
ncbi:MAG TPA: PA14 domain-containing protein [Longimicrobium sp.]|nr:PA14 domain-containing protein [Longimicrobium sp.]